MNTFSSSLSAVLVMPFVMCPRSRFTAVRKAFVILTFVILRHLMLSRVRVGFVPISFSSCMRCQGDPLFVCTIQATSLVRAE